MGEPSYKFITEKADWAKFWTLTEGLRLDDQHLTIDEKVDMLKKFIIDAAESSIPVSSGGKEIKFLCPGSIKSANNCTESGNVHNELCTESVLRPIG